MSEKLDLFKELIRNLAERQEWEEIGALTVGQHPADLAELIQESADEARDRLFQCIDREIQPDVLAELEPPLGATLLEHLSLEQISALVEAMEPDDAADVLGDLSREQVRQILAGMDFPEARQVRQLLRYDEESAGGIMTSQVVRFRGDMTVAEAIDHLARVDTEEPFYNLYITNRHGRLIGVVGLWELVKEKDRRRPLHQIAHTDFISVTTDMDQEKIAQLMRKYDLTSMPVVTTKGKLVGRITFDDVMDVLEEEATEDILRMGGAGDESLLYQTPWQACRFRLPWLLITLATGFVTSYLFRFFVDQLEQVLVLSFFIPIVLAMGGNTGIQSSTLIIRRIALGTLESGKLLRILAREFLGALLMGLICGLVISLWATFLVYHSPAQATAFSPLFLGAVVGVSLLCAMVFAAVFGAFTPILLERLKIDPAVASGPFVTSSNDIFALLIYYGVSFGLIALALN